MGLPCLNCGRDVELQDSKLFSECFVCADCHTIAERLYQQGMNELEYMRLTLKEIIRSAITRGQLALPPAPLPDFDGQLHQPRAIDLLVQMLKNKERCTTQQRNTKSSVRESTRPSAHTQSVVGKPSSPSASVQTSSSETTSTETLSTENSASA